MLDHDDRVADVAQVLEGGEELHVVPLVKSDRGLVEDVDDPCELRADLAREADPLALAAGQRGSGAVEGQIGEPHVQQEPQTRSDLLQELRGDLALGALQPKAGEELVGLAHGEGRDLRDRAASDLHAQRLRADAPPSAGGAGARGEELVVVLPHLLRLRLAHAPHHRVDGALVLHSERARAHGAPIAHLDPLLARAVEEDLAVRLRQRAPGGVQVDPALAGHRANDVAPPRRGLTDRAEGLDRPLVDREIGPWHHELGIHLHPDPEPGARGAHSLRRVEGEQLRRGLGEGDAAVVTGPVLRENPLGLPFRSHDDDPLAVAQRGLHRVGQASVDARLGDEAVHDRVERVLLLLVESDLVVEREDGPVHPHAGEPGLAHLLDHLAVLALALLDERREDQEPRSLRQLQDLAHDLLGRLLRDGPPAAVAAEASHAGPQHAEVVVDLGDRSHR